MRYCNNRLLDVWSQNALKRKNLIFMSEAKKIHPAIENFRSISYIYHLQNP